MKFLKHARRGAALALCAVLMAGLAAGCSKKPDAGAGSSAPAATGDDIPAVTMQFDDSLPQFTEPKGTDEVALIKTNKGNMLLRFLPGVAPKAVENFVTHAKDSYYDNLIFHRIIEGFMIQGGDPKGDGTGGESIWGKGFALEVSDQAFHFKGALAMAHSSLPDSNGSQFYIVQGLPFDDATISQLKLGGWPQPAVDKYKELGGTPQLDMDYTVFGQLLGGYDTLDAIAVLQKKVGGVPDEAGTPSEKVELQSVTILTYDEVKAAQAQ